MVENGWENGVNLKMGGKRRKRAVSFRSRSLTRRSACEWLTVVEDASKRVKTRSKVLKSAEKLEKIRKKARKWVKSLVRTESES
jgi:uncharacterized protein (DUF2384 family)